MSQEQYQVTGMTCAACQARVEKVVARVEGVESVTVSLLTNSMTVNGDYKQEELIQAVSDAGYGACPRGEVGQKESPSKKLAQTEESLRDTNTPKLIRRFLQSLLVLFLLMYLSMGHNMWKWPVPSFLEENYLGLALSQMMLASLVMMINKAFFIHGFKNLFHGAPDMDTLVALGSSVSYAWSLFVFYKMTWMVTNSALAMDLMKVYHNQLYFESAAMIPALITLGKTLESYSKGRTTDALKNLIQMAPKKATIEREGSLYEVDIDELQIGDIFVVKPGEAIPVDGIIMEGASAIDESALTGESIPVDKSQGDLIFAATINQFGFIKARASRVGEDTSFSKIIQMVSDAAGTKAPIARIADKVSGIFVPTVIGIAVIVLCGWLLAGLPLAKALEYAICVLVISCPCALGLATPVAIMVGNGLGAKNGILFKTSESLEIAGRTQIVALDKTGTITEGKPVVTDLLGGCDQEELLEKAYALEKMSEHPLAKAIVTYGEEKACETLLVEDFKAIFGKGLSGRIHGKRVYGGSFDFIKTITKLSKEVEDQVENLAGQGKTPLLFAEEDRFLGFIAVSDSMKEDSKAAVKELQNMGIQVVMLTGDKERTAKAIGAEAGVDQVVAGVLPEGKESVIAKLQKYGQVAMVGDGINDAPALTRADLGIAIGVGADVAIDSADVVLMNSRLTDVSAAIRLSRKTVKNIHENLFWAFAYNVLLIPMAAGLYPGIHLSPMWGAAAMSLSSFTVCINALRLNLARIHDHKKDHLLKKVVIEDLNSQEENTMTKTVEIEGMMCGHCEATVKKALEALDGVEMAEVSHEKKTAVISLSHDIEEELVKKTIEDKDFTFVSMK